MYIRIGPMGGNLVRRVRRARRPIIAKLHPVIQDKGSPSPQGIKQPMLSCISLCCRVIQISFFGWMGVGSVR
jgi:hypothetical protein